MNAVVNDKMNAFHVSHMRKIMINGCNYCSSRAFFLVRKQMKDDVLYAIAGGMKCNIFQMQPSTVNYFRNLCCCHAMPYHRHYNESFPTISISQEFHSPVVESIKWLVTICNITNAHCKMYDLYNLLTFVIHSSITLPSMLQDSNIARKTKFQETTNHLKMSQPLTKC